MKATAATVREGARLLVVLIAGVASAQESLAPAVERATRGLVHVSVLFETSKGVAVRVERSSSGFVVDPRGYVVTNEHLVREIPTGGGAEGKEYWLRVLLGERECGARVLARNERLDLALLQVELGDGERIDALELCAGKPPLPGADAFVVGRPQPREQVFALAGTVSTPSGPLALRQGTLEPGEALITDAAILDEVDGGPFVDRHGRVLGIMNTVQHVVYDVKAKEVSLQNPVDYAVAVTSTCILRAFGDSLVAGKPSMSVPGDGETAAAIVRAGAPFVVSVWAGAEKERPKRSAPKDPYAEKPEKGLGSGVIVDPAGLVLTSFEVVGEAKEVGVLLLDGRNFRAQVLRALPASRVALLQLALPEGVKLPAAELGSSAAALAGETIAVIGNPYGHTPTVSIGVLSALEVDERLRLGAWVHNGHKGGAVLDSAGRLIGLPAADIFEGRERERGESYLGVALPIDRVREALKRELAEHAHAPSLLAAPTANDADLARRRDKVTGIVGATRDSLFNVEIKWEEKSKAYDPFGTPGELLLHSQGSGVVIDASGLGITNWHVVEETLAADGSQRADRVVEVTLPSGKRYRASVLATSRDDDLALIQLELAEGDAVKPVALGSSQKLGRGDLVVAIGNPYGKANTVTTGIVAAKDREVPIKGRLHPYKNLLQTDAAINPGNSGGALLDIEGRLVAINSAGGMGAGFAIPVERMRDVFGEKLLTTMGPFLGLIVDDAASGVSVRTVEELSPAAAAGVQTSDVLRAIDGRAVASAMDYGNQLLALRSAAVMRVEVERGGKRLTLEVQPITQAAWRLFRQTGIEVAEVDYATNAELVREASLALHRAYTGLADGEPSRVMSGALRVVQVKSGEKGVLDVKVGDLLLGGTAVVRTIDAEMANLVRFESVAALRDFMEPLATREGGTAECWLLRDGKVITVRVPVVKVR